MTRRITVLLRGGHEIVLQGVDEEDAERLLHRFSEIFDQSEVTGCTATPDGTLIRHSEVVAVRDLSEQALSNRSGRHG